ncbi:unnamed protein product [Ectocarpus sp. 6 AP-2014]
METILGGQNVLAATAGILSDRSAEGTAPGSSVGWLAIARPATLELWLESETSGDRSRGLNVANETELDDRVLALAACPRPNGGGDDLLVVTVTLAWELFRLNPRHRFRELPKGRADACVELSVLASGFLGPSPPRDVHRASRATSPDEVLRLTVRGPGHWRRWSRIPALFYKGRDSGQESTRKIGAKTLVACVCEGAIILLVFSQDTPGHTAMTTSSATVTLIPENVRESSANISTNSDGQPRGKHRQSPRDLALSKKSRMPPPTLSGFSTVLDLAILSAGGSEESETTRIVDSSAVVALLLTNEAEGGGGSADGVGNCGNGFNDAQETFLRTWRWVLSDGGEGVLRPGRWGLANLHPSTCITALARGGILCVDPDGVNVFSEDGVPLLDVNRSNLGGNFVHCPLDRNVHPVVLTPFGSIRQGGTNGSEEFLLADMDGILHLVTVDAGHPKDAFRGSTRHAEQSTTSGHGSWRGDHARIKRVELKTSSELVPCHLRHQRIEFLLSVGSEGLVFASMRSSPFPIIVRMPCPSGDLPSGVGLGLGGESGATAFWKMLERSEEGRSSPCIGAVSDLIVLPALRGDEQQSRPRDVFANNKAPNAKQGTPNESRNTFQEEDATLRFSKTSGKTTPRGVRVALTTRPVGLKGASCESSADDPAKSLALLDLGLKLDTDAKGSIGLPEGATLFAQPVSAGRASCSKDKQRGRSSKEDNRQESADEKGECDASQRGHVLLLSDRVRNASHVLAVSSEGEIALAFQGETKGFDTGLHTVHLGRIEPAGYIVQVTEESVNIVQQSAEQGVFETVGFWRPPPPSSPSTTPSAPFFKVQHACTAGAMVALASASTMILVKVQIGAQSIAEQTTPFLRGEAPISAEMGGTPAVRELRQMELDGGPVSAMGMRLQECNGVKYEDAGRNTNALTQAALIATASWDSPCVAVFSFSTPSTATNCKTGSLEDREKCDQRSDNTAALERLATWYPPWGRSSPPHGAMGRDTSNSEAGAAKDAALGDGGSGAPILTRALAFVCFKNESEPMSLVAAAADGSVAVATWQEVLSGEAKGNIKGKDHGQTERSRRRHNHCSQDTLVTVALFQIGEGPVRLEVFLGPRRVDGTEKRRSGGDAKDHAYRNQAQDTLFSGGERMFVNSDTMDAVVYWCSNSPAPDQSRRGWQCSQQVSRMGGYPRQSVVHLPQKVTASGTTGEKFAWLTTAEPTRRSRATTRSRVSSSYFDGESRGHSRWEAGIGGKISSRELSLSFGTLDESEPRGQLCRKSPLPWTPTHLLYVPATRSIVVACHTNGENDGDEDHLTTTARAAAAPIQRARQNMPSSLPTGSSKSRLQIFDADTLEERPGAGPLQLQPGVRVTGIALLSCPGGGGGLRQALAPVAQGAPRIDEIPMAVGGDVVTVSCCSCVKEGTTATTDNGQEAVDGGVQGCVEEKAPAPVGSTFRGSGADSPLNASTAAIPTSSATPPPPPPPPPPPLPSGTASVKTVIAAFEVVAYSTDDCGCGMELAAIAASPEIAGACFGLKALGNRFVVASADDRVIVLGWKGHNGGGFRPGVPPEPLNLTAQASCRTPSGGCVTALGTYGKFVAVAEFLNCVSLYDESARTLCLVARHARDSLIVDVLALSPHSSFPPAPTGVGVGRGETTAVNGIPLVAVADRTTKTVAVLACTHRRLPAASTRDGNANRNVSDIEEEEADIVMPHCGGGDDDIDRSNRGAAVDGAARKGSCDSNVRLLRLLSVWPCQDKVTSLVAASGSVADNRAPPMYTGGLDENDGRLFLLGTGCGEVLTVGIDAPSRMH